MVASREEVHRLGLITGSQTRDLKYEHCLSFAHRDWKTQEPKIAELKDVLGAYRHNISRVRTAITFLANIGSSGVDMQRWASQAEFDVMGRLGADTSDEQKTAINDRMAALSHADVKENFAKVGSPEWDTHVERKNREGMLPIQLLCRAKQAENAMVEMFASWITGTWTAFEALAGDLWETSLNIQPEGLAHLGGSPNRYNKNKNADKNQRQQPRRQEQDESKSIPLDLIQAHRFEIRNRMGTILRSKFDFTKLSGIREAYACAFDKNDGMIERYLRDDALDALSAVRNLLVHKRGLVDEKYLKQTHNLKTVPTADIGKRIELDGEIVVNLLDPARHCGVTLIAEVDAWIRKKRG